METLCTHTLLCSHIKPVFVYYLCIIYSTTQCKLPVSASAVFLRQWLDEKAPPAQIAQRVIPSHVQVEWLHQLKEEDTANTSLLCNTKMETEGSGYTRLGERPTRDALRSISYRFEGD